MPPTRLPPPLAPSALFDRRIAELSDWRGQLMVRLRKLIQATVPALQEDWKWGTAVWTQKGNVVSLAAMKEHVKLTFFKGAALPDPQHVFNNGLDAKAMRSIDFHEGDPVAEEALKELLRAAAAYDLPDGKKI
jgi:hypothetical protein